MSYFGWSLQVDSERCAYVCGFTDSANFPTTPGAYDNTFNGGDDIVVLKLTPDGSELDYSTYIGGIDREGSYRSDISIDSERNIYVFSNTASPNFPTTLGAYDNIFNGYSDAILCKVSHDGSELDYSTFIGGLWGEYPSDIVVDDDNNAYIIGDTTSQNFPTTSGAYDNTFNGEYDIFICKMNPQGSNMVYGTYLGGQNADYGQAIALDSNHNVYFCGDSRSDDFPTTLNCFDNTRNGNWDIVFGKFNDDGSELLYSTYIGGGGSDSIYWNKIHIDQENEETVFISGDTGSSNFPTSPGCYDETYDSMGDLFTFKFKISLENIPPIVCNFSLENHSIVNKDSVIITGKGWDANNPEKIESVEVSIDSSTWELVNGTVNWDHEWDTTTIDNGEHTLRFRAYDGELYSGIQELILDVQDSDSNIKPNASINSIIPNPALDTDNIHFQGQGTDDGSIEQYAWKSSIDGEFYNGTDSSFFCDNLSNGKHTIYFKVQDDFGIWSDEVSETLIIHEKPTAIIDKIDPNPTEEGENVYFYGYGIDDGTIVDYQWSSSIDGYLSDTKSIKPSNLSIGKHTIYFKVKDDNGIWSDEVYGELLIKPKIQKKPDMTIEDKDIKIMGALIEGETLEITAKIQNIGETEGTATIKIYDEGPSNEELILIENKITIPVNEYYIISCDWTFYEEGEHSIFVVVENCEPNEIDTQNNDAFKRVEILKKKEDNPTLSIPEVLTYSSLGILIVYLGIAWSTEYGKYKLLTFFYLPLYNRFKKEKILDHEIRGMIKGYIIANPGANYTLLQKELNLAKGTLTYHLSVLEEEKIIKSRNDGKFKRFFSKSVKAPNINKVMSQLRLQIFTIIEENPGISTKELASRIGISRQLMNLHLRVLKGAIPPYILSEKNGRTIQYYINTDENEEEDLNVEWD